MIGIIQGRLSPPIEGFQETPKNWKAEFELLKTLGIPHIEWVLTSLDNPLFKENLKPYPVSSVCADHIITKQIFEKTFLSQALEPVCVAAIKNNIQNITIPLLEESSIEKKARRSELVDGFLPVVDSYPSLNFSIEAELEAQDLLEIVTLRDNIFVTYDTGNITSFGVPHDEYITILKEKIDNVHLKDRTFSARTVPPFEGDTDFELIFKTLKNIGYKGRYTLQTAREKDGEETTTVLKHLQLFKERGYLLPDYIHTTNEKLI